MIPSLFDKKEREKFRFPVRIIVVSSWAGTRCEHYSFFALFSRPFGMSQKSSRKDLPQHGESPRQTP